MLALLICAFALTAAPAQIAEDYEIARRDYIDLVRDLINEELLAETDLETARSAIAALVKTGNPAVFDTLSVDAAALGERVRKMFIDLEETRLEIDRRTEKLADLTGSEREAAADKLAEKQKEAARLEVLLPILRGLREAIYEGLLDVTGRAADTDPEMTWKLLVAYFQLDTSDYYELDQGVREIEAALKSVRERLPGTADEQEKEKLEKREVRLAARLEEGLAERERRGRLKDRRIEVLGSLYPRLSKGAQGRELRQIQDNLKDSVEWKTRAVFVELLGHVPADGVVSDILTVMKRAAKASRDVARDLESLREAYNRALKAVMTSITGSGGVVPVATLETKNRAERELKDASNRTYGEARVVESAASALGCSLAGLDEQARAGELDAVFRVIDKDSDREVRTRVIDALGRVDDERVRAELRGLLTGSSDLRARLATLDALAALKDEPTVELCVTELLRDGEWRVRAAAIRYLVQVPRKNAVPALIQSVAAEVGRLVDDAEQALTALTGKSFNADANLWRDWWSKNKDTFQIGEVGAVAAAGPAAGDEGEWKSAPGHVSFYGISTRSNRILFVLDRSGSMNEPVGKGTTGPGTTRKIDAAKAQLKSALSGLEDGDQFNIITYAVDVDRWQKNMIKMTTTSRKKVTKYVDREIEAAGGTNIYDALELAFRLAGIGAMDRAYESNVDTIFFLTDGQPTAGEVQDTAEILRRVREWNRLARIVVHTVGVGIDHDAAFLRRLAEENGGQYVSR